MVQQSLLIPEFNSRGVPRPLPAAYVEVPWPEAPVPPSTCAWHSPITIGLPRETTLVLVDSTVTNFNSFHDSITLRLAFPSKTLHIHGVVALSRPDKLKTLCLVTHFTYTTSSRVTTRSLALFPLQQPC
ncbi:hypothetical protein M514_05215 [Trichuris suis]|uniref:Uncharacterized protein n=1 Tax=Trichuris suis TaxID=68888 RepID=A0A085M9Q2_9BILA|nr:hypothetical protein M513_05215 [Trichuris suis]KFD59693.1 hypothetical protein M514_05215 [Trichuris suis]